MTQRDTRQLVAVYEVVRAARDHPTAEQVFERVRAHLPHVSLGTVYRNLQKLAALDRIRVVPLADRALRYDGMVDPHDHFYCEACGDVIDLPVTGSSAADTTDLAGTGFEVRGQTLIIFGRCPACSRSRA